MRISGCSQEKCASPRFQVGGISDPAWNGLACESEDTFAGRCVEVSLKIWYEHIVAAALPSMNPPSYGVR